MTSAHDFTLPSIGGGEIRLKDFAGEAVLLVNTASECGFTPQYRDLEALWRERKGKRLVVLGVPSNDFGAQEPGTNADVRKLSARRITRSRFRSPSQAAGARRRRASALSLDRGGARRGRRAEVGTSTSTSSARTARIAGAWPSKVASEVGRDREGHRRSARLSERGGSLARCSFSPALRHRVPRVPEGRVTCPSIILHQYDASPYAYKARICMGFKKLAWRAVEIPMVMPKPLLMPLTGGYRQALR